MKETEIERVFLVKELPNLKNCRHITIRVGDFFDSNRIDALKIKQKGDRYFLVKKEGESAKRRTEHTIEIKKGEFDVLYRYVTQKHEKARYLYNLEGDLCEIDLYQGKLLGYVRAEVEFKDAEHMKKFIPPAWFGPEITELNHEIHENLGTVTYEEMKKRYSKKGILLKKVFIA
jgi:adenylate cyclase